MIKLKSLLEVLKDKDGNIRTDLKYTDNKNYQPRIEVTKETTEVGDDQGPTDEGGGEWGMEGSMAFHGDIEDFDIDTLEKDETKRN
mgnify:CR=1 FL=1